VEYFRTLYEIAKKLNSPLAVDDVLDNVVQCAAEGVGAKACSLLLLSPDRKRLVHTVSYGLSDSYLRKGPIRFDSAALEALQGRPMAILNAPEDPSVQYPHAARQEAIASMLSIPVTLEQDVIGVLRLYTSQPREFSDQEIEFLGAIANLGALALERARHIEVLGKDLEQRTNEVSRLEEEKGQFLLFVSSAAHDLKAPLAAVQSYLSLLLGGFVGELTERQRNIVGRSSLRISGLLDLINDLLDIPRIQDGMISEEMEGLNLKEILNGPLEIAYRSAEEKGLQLKVDIPRRLPTINGSRARLQQVVTNLLTNAVNYTNRGGAITLRTRCKYDEVCIEVSDTGVGICAEDLPRVFEDFFRGSNVEPQGTGLGLSIAKRIVEAHGGRIWVESPCPESNTGSKFTFTLPKKSETERRQQ